MYFQFLIEDKSTEILVNHVMDKMQKWLLGDAEAIKKAYPNARMHVLKNMSRMQFVKRGKYLQIWFIRKECQNSRKNQVMDMQRLEKQNVNGPIK